LCSSPNRESRTDSHPFHNRRECLCNPRFYVSHHTARRTVAGSGAATGANSGADANRAEYSVVLTHPPGMREDETVSPRPASPSSFSAPTTLLRTPQSSSAPWSAC
jgi:hypothetical protein